MRILIIALIGSIFIALCIGIWGDGASTGSKNPYGYTLADHYSLVMKPQPGREFNRGKDMTYTASKRDGQLVFEMFYTESGGIFGKASSLNQTITVDQRTLSGTWVGSFNGKVQGGEAQLIPNKHGFEIISKAVYGPYAGQPPAFGQLIAIP